MTSKQLQDAHDLMAGIGSVNRLLAKYRKASEIIIGLPPEPRSGFHQIRDEVRVTAADLGGAIAAILQGRLAAMKTDLHALGVNWTEDEDDQAPDEGPESPQ